MVYRIKKSNFYDEYKQALDKYKSYSYGKLVELETKIPNQIRSLDISVEKLENENKNLFDRKYKYDQKIDEIVTKHLGEGPENRFGINDNWLWIAGYLFSFVIIHYYLLDGHVWGLALFFALIGMGPVTAILELIYKHLYLKPFIERPEKNYQNKKRKYEEVIRKRFLQKLDQPVKKIDDKIEKNENEISKKRKLSMSLSNIQDKIYFLKSRAKKREEKAKISAFDKKAREGSQVVKNDLLKATKNKSKWKCPYCNLKNNIKDSEADHIHPINKGGLSTPQNMVLICKKCNSKKSAFTLRVFCKKMNFNFNNVCERLENLGKDI